MKMYSSTGRKAVVVPAAITLLATVLSAGAVLKVSVTGPGGQMLPKASASLLTAAGETVDGEKNDDGLFVFPGVGAGSHILQVTDSSLGGAETRAIKYAGGSQTVNVALNTPIVPQLAYPAPGRYAVEGGVRYTAFTGDSPLESGLEFSLLARVALFGVFLNNALNWPQRDNLYLFGVLSYATYDPDFYSSATAITAAGGLGWYYWCRNISPFGSNNAKFRIGLNGRIYTGYTRAEVEWDRQAYQYMTDVWDGHGWREDTVLVEQDGGSKSDGALFAGFTGGPRLRSVNYRWDIGADFGVRTYVSELNFGRDNYDGRLAYLLGLSTTYVF